MPPELSNRSRRSRVLLHAWIIFFISSSMFVASQFYRASNAVISPFLIRDLGLNAEGLGLLSAVFFYAFAFAQLPVGILLDRLGARRAMAAFTLVAVLGALVFAHAGSLSAGIVGRVLMGAGMAANLIGTLKLLTTWFGPAAFATLSGVALSIGTIGNMAAATPFVLLVQRHGWRMGFTLIAGFNLVQIAVLYAVVRDRPPQGEGPDGSLRPELKLREILAGLRLLFKNRDYWIISSGAFFRYGVFAAVQTLWAGPYLINAMGLSPVAAGNLIFLLNIGLIAGGPSWGGMSDKVFKNRRWIVAASLLAFSASTLGIALFPKGGALAILTFFFFCFGFSAGTANVLYAHIKDLMPLELSGVAMTGINFFTMMGAAVFVQGLGSLMQRAHPGAALEIGAFRSAFLLCAAALLLASIFYLFSREADRNRSTSRQH